MEIVTLKVVDLAIGYEKPLIRNINVELESPYILLIIGPNGVGKTTFLKTLIGFIRPHAGKVYVNQIDITGNSELAGVFMDYVPQLSRFTSTTGFPITVWEFVEFGLTIHLKKMGLRMDKSEMQRIIKETFNTVGIDKSLWDRSIWKLSGGEMQRLFMARALVNNQPIILLDEPLSSIDPEGKMEIIDVISILKKDKIILITCHDPEIFLGICDNVMIFGRGVYYIGKPMEVLNIDVLGRIYGKSVIKFKDHVHIYDHHN